MSKTQTKQSQDTLEKAIQILKEELTWLNNRLVETKNVTMQGIIEHRINAIGAFLQEVGA